MRQTTVLLTISVIANAVTAQQYRDAAEPPSWSQEELNAKWGWDWGWSGIVTYAHRPHTRCLQWAQQKYDIAFLGVPFDTAVSYRPGARFGPRAIRIASARQNAGRGHNPRAGFNPYGQWAFIMDCGDMTVTAFDNVLALRQMTEGYTNLAYSKPPAKSLSSSVSYRHVPKLITFGGDHSVTLPALRALNKVHKEVTVVHFDAHLGTISWGRPDEPAKQPSLTHRSMFQWAQNEGLLSSNRSIHVGLRGRLSGANDYDDDDAQGWQRIACDDIDDLGTAGIANKIMARVGTESPVYLSIDIDVIDPGLAPGTGTPEPGGWSTREVIHILRGIESLNVVGAAIVEVAPAFDDSGEKTALAAAQIVFEVLTSMVKKGMDEPAETADSHSEL